MFDAGRARNQDLEEKLMKAWVVQEANSANSGPSVLRQLRRKLSVRGQTNLSRDWGLVSGMTGAGARYGLSKPGVAQP